MGTIWKILQGKSKFHEKESIFFSQRKKKVEEASDKSSVRNTKVKTAITQIQPREEKERIVQGRICKTKHYYTKSKKKGRT